MTLVQLEYIIAVDAYRSFVLAAEKTFVTQPTLSMQIQKLERSLDVKIFDRSKQPVIPTEIGKKIIQQARHIIAESQKVKEIVHQSKDEMEGELRIGIIPTVAPYLLPKVLGSFIKKYPRVEVNVWEYTTDKILQSLANGLLDCGILATPVGADTVLETPLYYENFIAYLCESSPLLMQKQVSANDVLGDKLWLLTEGHCMRNQVLNICQRKRSMQGKKNLEYNTGSVETLKRMVDTNAGITILPELALNDFSDEEMERVRYFHAPEPVREISLVTDRNFLKRRMITAFCKEIKGAVPPHLLNPRKKEIVQID